MKKPATLASGRLSLLVGCEWVTAAECGAAMEVKLLPGQPLAAASPPPPRVVEKEEGGMQVLCDRAR